jgi:putative transposase
MNCKFCNSPYTMKYGFKAGIQYYKCNVCHRKFSGRLALEGMRFNATTVGEAMGLFYDGLSLSDISRHLLVTEGIKADPVTVWRWVIKFSKLAQDITAKTKIRTSWRWVIDETMIKVEGRNVWLWDVIEARTRFLLATHLTKTRNMRSAIAVLSTARDRVIGTPSYIVSDGMRAYPDAIEQVFGAESTHIRSKGITAEINTNIIERFQGTVKERTKVMRGLKTMETAEIISEGFIVHYNFLRPHMALDGKTPAAVSGLKYPFKTWIELVDFVSKNGKTT